MLALRYYSQIGGFWVRLLGYGVSVRDRRQHPPIFSERNGYTRYLDVGRWRLRWLPKEQR